MKLRLFLLTSLLIFSFALFAQEDVEGEIKVYQDEAIRNLIGTPRTDTTIQGSSIYDDDNTVRAYPEENKRGNYRILVFSGNDKKRSKNEAMSKRDLVKGRFPEITVDVHYDSPVWKVRAGFYTNKIDAENALHVLKNAFPSFGKEMYIVRVSSKSK